jgi:hypothetical protein
MSYAPNTPKLAKGAFVEFSQPFLGPIPNIIVFQYNPETLERNILSSGVSEGIGQESEKKGSNPLASPTEPSESFSSIKLVIDATDQLEDPVKHPVTLANGIGPQLAALELLVYPLSKQLLGNFFSIGSKKSVPENQVPAVLFVWGPSRLLPVRLTSLSITEESFDQMLNPIRATVTVGLKVLTKGELNQIKSPLAKVVQGAYEYTRGRKEAMARFNLVSSGEFLIQGLIR